MRFLELIKETTKPAEQPAPSLGELVRLYSRGMSDIQMARHLFPDLSEDAIRARKQAISTRIVSVRRSIDVARDQGTLPQLAAKIGVSENELLLVIGPRPRPNLSAAARHIVNTNRPASWSEMESLLRQWAIENGKVCHPNSVSKAIQIARKEAGLGERRLQKEPERPVPHDPAAKWRDEA